MRVIRPTEIAPEPATDAIFTGPVERQLLVDPEKGAPYNASVVTFKPGGRTKWHTHSQDQLLIVTYGTGILATETENNEVHQGELIHIPAGEKHWHGSTGSTTFSHISLLLAGTTYNILD